MEISQGKIKKKLGCGLLQLVSPLHLCWQNSFAVHTFEILFQTFQKKTALL